MFAPPENALSYLQIAATCVCIMVESKCLVMLQVMKEAPEHLVRVVLLSVTGKMHRIGSVAPQRPQELPSLRRLTNTPLERSGRFGRLYYSTRSLPGWKKQTAVSRFRITCYLHLAHPLAVVYASLRTERDLSTFYCAQWCVRPCAD